MSLDLVDPGLLVLLNSRSFCFCCLSFVSMFSGCRRVSWACRGVDSCMDIWSHRHFHSNTLQRVSTNTAGTCILGGSLCWDCSARWRHHHRLWGICYSGFLCLFEDASISKLNFSLNFSRLVVPCHSLLFSFFIFLLLCLCFHGLCIFVHQRTGLKRTNWGCKAH